VFIVPKEKAPCRQRDFFWYKNKSQFMTFSPSKWQ